MTEVHVALMFFRYFFSQSFVDDLVAFWCHPSTCCKDQGVEQRLLNANHSLVVLNILFFMLLLDLQKGLVRIRLWGRGWVTVRQKSFSHSYLTVLIAKYPTLHCQQYWLFFQNYFHWLAKVWVLSEHLYRPFSLSESITIHWVVPHWSTTSQFAYKAVIHIVCVSAKTVSEYALYFLSISHSDGVTVEQLLTCSNHGT